MTECSHHGEGCTTIHSAIGESPVNNVKEDRPEGQRQAVSDLSKTSTSDLIHELEQRGVVNSHHTVQIRFADFSMKHTLTCQPDLFHCDLHKMVENCYLNNGGLSPWKEGTYVIDPKTRELSPV